MIVARRPCILAAADIRKWEKAAADTPRGAPTTERGSAASTDLECAACVETHDA